jgi:hypothetical protein
LKETNLVFEEFQKEEFYSIDHIFKAKQSSQQITYSQPSMHKEATAGKRDHHYGSVAATKAAVMIGTENR